MRETEREGRRRHQPSIPRAPRAVDPRRLNPALDMQMMGRLPSPPPLPPSAENACTRFPYGMQCTRRDLPAATRGLCDVPRRPRYPLRVPVRRLGGNLSLISLVRGFDLCLLLPHPPCRPSPCVYSAAAGVLRLILGEWKGTRKREGKKKEDPRG